MTLTDLLVNNWRSLLRTVYGGIGGVGATGCVSQTSCSRSYYYVLGISAQSLALEDQNWQDSFSQVTIFNEMLILC
jgi:hypothetical protein